MKLATFKKRAFAYLIDLWPIFPVSVFGLLILFKSNSLILGLILFILMLLSNGIVDIIESLFFKNTLGKIVTGIAVKKKDGSQLDFATYLKRYLVSYPYSESVILAFSAPWEKPTEPTFHDKFSGTTVLDTKNKTLSLPIQIIGFLIMFLSSSGIIVYLYFILRTFIHSL